MKPMNNNKNKLNSNKNKLNNNKKKFMSIATLISNVVDPYF